MSANAVPSGSAPSAGQTAQAAAPTPASTQPAEEILDNITESIGNTPTVRLHRVPKVFGMECELLVKCEFMNPGGSVKDRIALQMVKDAEAAGRIEPGRTRLVEPTSGNTGVGLGVVGAALGYDVVVVMPAKMSKEKETAMKCLGEKVVRTPTVRKHDDPRSHMAVAHKIVKDDRSGLTVTLDQYNNPSNPLAHELTTGPEIVRQCGGRVDMIVCGAGTGGTITGIARAAKKVLPNVIIVGVDPVGSILGGNDGHRGEPWEIEGIGYDFFPESLDRTMVDHWVKVDDAESFLAARMMQRDEGILCGGSSGCAVVAAAKAAKQYGFGPDKRVVALLPDSIRNYMTKFASDEWLTEKGLPVPSEMPPRTTAPQDVPPSYQP